MNPSYNWGFGIAIENKPAFNLQFDMFHSEDRVFSVDIASITVYLTPACVAMRTPLRMRHLHNEKTGAVFVVTQVKLEEGFHFHEFPYKLICSSTMGVGRVTKTLDIL